MRRTADSRAYSGLASVSCMIAPPSSSYHGGGGELQGKKMTSTSSRVCIIQHGAVGCLYPICYGGQRRWALYCSIEKVIESDFPMWSTIEASNDPDAKRQRQLVRSSDRLRYRTFWFRSPFDRYRAFWFRSPFDRNANYKDGPRGWTRAKRVFVAKKTCLGLVSENAVLRKVYALVRTPQ